MAASAPGGTPPGVLPPAPAAALPASVPAVGTAVVPDDSLHGAPAPPAPGASHPLHDDLTLYAAGTHVDDPVVDLATFNHDAPMVASDWLTSEAAAAAAAAAASAPAGARARAFAADQGPPDPYHVSGEGMEAVVDRCVLYHVQWRSGSSNRIAESWVPCDLVRYASAR
jgi:hypothetical protein